MYRENGGILKMKGGINLRKQRQAELHSEDNEEGRDKTIFSLGQTFEKP